MPHSTARDRLLFVLAVPEERSIFMVHRSAMSLNAISPSVSPASRDDCRSAHEGSSVSFALGVAHLVPSDRSQDQIGEFVNRKRLGRIRVHKLKAECSSRDEVGQKRACVEDVGRCVSGFDGNLQNGSAPPLDIPPDAVGGVRLPVRSRASRPSVPALRRDVAGSPRYMRLPSTKVRRSARRCPVALGRPIPGTSPPDDRRRDEFRLRRPTPSDRPHMDLAPPSDLLDAEGEIAASPRGSRAQLRG